LLMLAVYSDPRWLSVVRGAVERLTETLGFPAMPCRSITRAVDEALTNIVNLRQVRYIDSSGVASLIEGLKASRDLGSRFYFDRAEDIR